MSLAGTLGSPTAYRDALPVPVVAGRRYDETMEFRIDEVLVHRKTGGRYRILIGPDVCRLEATGEPAYAYRRDDAPASGDFRVWVRVAREMEDGRFERC